MLRLGVAVSSRLSCRQKGLPGTNHRSGKLVKNRTLTRRSDIFVSVRKCSDRIGQPILPPVALPRRLSLKNAGDVQRRDVTWRAT